MAAALESGETSAVAAFDAHGKANAYGGALRALVWARRGTGLTAATPRADLEWRWGVLVAASPPEGDQPVGLRAFLNADHYLTTDTIAQYDRYLQDLQVLGNVAPSVVVVLLDGFVDWVTRTLQEWVVPHERTLFCVSDVIAGYRGHHWFAVWVDFTRGNTGKVRSRTHPGCGAHRAARSGGRQPLLAPHPAQA
jgi:hypothetical protein